MKRTIANVTNRQHVFHNQVENINKTLAIHAVIRLYQLLPLWRFKSNFLLFYDNLKLFCEFPDS